MKNKKENRAVFGSVEKTKLISQDNSKKISDGKYKITWKHWRNLLIIFLILYIFFPMLALGVGIWVCFAGMSWEYWKEKKRLKGG